MKIYISAIIVSTFLCSYVNSVTAATGSDIVDSPIVGGPSAILTSIDNEIANINTSILGEISFDSAPSPGIISDGIVYTPWELLHRTPMLAGFLWMGGIAEFITPQMFLGTPFGLNPGYMGYMSPYASSFQSPATTYAECVTRESYFSYGIGNRIKQNDIEEFKAIAKVCAKNFYGTYFDAKTYTTREEFLMMMFTLFEEEDIEFQGQFTIDGKYIEGENGSSETGFDNVSKKAWYASYLKRANMIGILADETEWIIGKTISNTEAIEYLLYYAAYRMNFQGDILDRGSIVTGKLKYNLTFLSDTEIAIRAQ